MPAGSRHRNFRVGGANAKTLLASSFDRCALSDVHPKSAFAYRADAFFLPNAETGKGLSKLDYANRD
jgi:hypothetical protein